MRTLAATDVWLHTAPPGDVRVGCTQDSIQTFLTLCTLRRNTMMFDKTTRVQSDPRGEERRFFGRTPYIQPGTY